MQEVTQEEPNPLMRKKKTPEELAAEAEAEDEDEITSRYTLNRSSACVATRSEEQGEEGTASNSRHASGERESS